MSKRTLTRVISGVVAAAALTVGVTAPTAQAAHSHNAGKQQIVQYRDTGWD
jgi:hypothetical protein